MSEETPIHEQRMQEALLVSLSCAIGERIRALPNRCFDNAWRSFVSFPELFAAGAFVEGWIVLETEESVVLNEHGWCMLPGGTIIDPSILLLVPPEQPVYYFPAITRGWEEMQHLLEQEDITFPYVRFDGVHGEDGMLHSAYKAAYEAARAKVEQLAQETNPPKKQIFSRAVDNLDGDGDSPLIFLILAPDVSGLDA